MYNLKTNEWLTFSFEGTLQYGIETNNRVIAVGRKNSKGYITKFYPESILAHTDYTKITMNMISYTPLSLSITSLIGVTISNVISESVTSVTNNNETISYSNTTLSTSDTIFLVDSESLSYIESYSTTVSVNLPCSSSGTTLITYSTGNYNGATPPAWVTINSSTGVMTINTPIITSASSDFSFYIYSSSGSFFEFCSKTCYYYSPSICETCNAGYDLMSGSCIIQSTSSSGATSGSTSSTTTSSPVASTSSSSSSSQSSSSTASTSAGSISKKDVSDEAKAVKIAMECIVGVCTGLILISQVINSSSLSSLWSLVNQMQLFFLLLISGVFIHQDVINVIVGLKIAICPFEMIPIKRIKLFESPISLFSFELENSNLELLGFESGSIISSNYSTFINLIMISILHLLVYLVYKYVVLGIAKDSKSCVVVLFNKIITKVYVILTFGYYIRIALEINQFLLISSISEINQFSYSGAYRKASLTIAFASLILCLIMMGIVIWLASTSSEESDNSEGKLSEFFNGVKPIKLSRYSGEKIEVYMRLKKEFGII